MAENKFSGPWTLIKLEIIEKYLGFYTAALKNICHKFGWRLLYINAFAGSGECFIKDFGVRVKTIKKLSMEY